MHSPSEAARPDDREPTLAELVTALAGRLRSAWRDGLAPWGLSPHQGRALLVIAGREDLRPGELASRLRISPRSVTEVVDGLVEAGLVERRPDPKDRRATTLHLTARGSRLVDEVRASREEVADALFSTLSERDRAYLQRTLRRLAADDPHR